MRYNWVVLFGSCSLHNYITISSLGSPLWFVFIRIHKLYSNVQCRCEHYRKQASPSPSNVLRLFSNSIRLTRSTLLDQSNILDKGINWRRILLVTSFVTCRAEPHHLSHSHLHNLPPEVKSVIFMSPPNDSLDIILTQVMSRTDDRVRISDDPRNWNVDNTQENRCKSRLSLLLLFKTIFY